MQVHGHWVFAFGYPNRPPAGGGVGPRVNEAALAYWDGPFGVYEFRLSAPGRAHAFQALQKLFVLQRPKKRTAPRSSRAQSSRRGDQHRLRTSWPTW